MEELTAALKELKLKNINLINETPKSGAENFSISFIHPKETKGVLIELCERKK